MEILIGLGVAGAVTITSAIGYAIVKKRSTNELNCRLISKKTRCQRKNGCEWETDLDTCILPNEKTSIQLVKELYETTRAKKIPSEQDLAMLRNVLSNYSISINHLIDTKVMRDQLQKLKNDFQSNPGKETERELQKHLLNIGSTFQYILSEMRQRQAMVGGLASIWN